MAADYEAEPHEVQTVLDVLVGEREPGDDLLARSAYLSSRQALILAVSSRIADQQALLADELYRQIADDQGRTSYAKVAERLGMSRSRAQQLIERARRLNTPSSS